MAVDSKITIITGASRGLGLALATQLLESGHDVLGISRSHSAALQDVAKKTNAKLTQWTHDLSDPVPVAQQLAHWLQSLPEKPQHITLINNAAVLPTLAPLSQVPFNEISQSLRLGLEAVMLLTGAFLGATQSWSADKRVLNISSGNGRRAMAGQATYSATKAGMDHYTRCVALEEAAKPLGAKLCSLAPGVVDTDMQSHLRSADPKAFSSQSLFVDYHRQGLLTPADEAAARVLTYLARADFGSNAVADTREA